MQSDWASRNLHVIRTLMERSAVYRHALAPVMAAIGLTGIGGAVLETVLKLQTSRAFAIFWMGVGMLCILEAFALIRWQAFHDSEPFWSPPTRRVTQALAPPFFAGFVAGLVFLRFDSGDAKDAWLLVPSWMVLYGCALHSAGFFMPRGFKLFGWAFIVAGCAFGIGALFFTGQPGLTGVNFAMGALFGGSHWAYATYLYFTERRRRLP